MRKNMKMFSELNQGFYITAEDSWSATRNSPPVHCSFSKHLSSSSNLFFWIPQLFSQIFSSGQLEKLNTSLQSGQVFFFLHRGKWKYQMILALNPVQREISVPLFLKALPLIKELSNFCERLPVLPYFCQWAKEMVHLWMACFRDSSLLLLQLENWSIQL